MPTFRYVVADVFTDRPLAGNQLAVFTDAREIPDEQLQPLAKEMNFSETVFVYPPEQGGHVKIRIFTPAAEMPFAGHPVLGTAFVLAGPLQLGHDQPGDAQGHRPGRARARRGTHRLRADVAADPGGLALRPRRPSSWPRFGSSARSCPSSSTTWGSRYVYVALPSEEAVAALEPDYAALARIQGYVGT